MKFCKLLKYDFENGILKKWYLYLITFFIAVIFVGDFYRKYTIINGNFDDKFTRTNILFYLFQGKEVFLPEWGSPFVFPVVWLFVFILSNFFTLDYPMKSLSGYGIQVITRIKKRAYWWKSKCIWIVFSNMIYFSIWYLGVFIFCKIAGVEISLAYSNVINEKLLEMQIETLTPELEIILLIILPMLTSMSFNFLQLCLELFIDKIYCFLIVVFLMFMSTYFKIPVAIGNFAMIKRSIYCIEDGMSVSMGLVINGMIIISCIVIGFWRINKYDILKKENI